MKSPSGPCLCGDPHCPRCGDPGAAAYEDAMESILEQVDNIIRELNAPPEFLEAMLKGKIWDSSIRDYYIMWLSGQNFGLEQGVRDVEVVRDIARRGVLAAKFAKARKTNDGGE